MKSKFFSFSFFFFFLTPVNSSIRHENQESDDPRGEADLPLQQR